MSAEPRADEEGLSFVSFALGICQDAIKNNAALQKTVEELPDVVFSAKATPPQASPRALVFLRTAEGANVLARVDNTGKMILVKWFSGRSGSLTDGARLTEERAVAKRRISANCPISSETSQCLTNGMWLAWTHMAHLEISPEFTVLVSVLVWQSEIGMSQAVGKVRFDQ